MYVSGRCKRECTGSCHIAVSSGENLCRATIRVTSCDGRIFSVCFFFFMNLKILFLFQEAALGFTEEFRNTLESLLFRCRYCLVSCSPASV